MAYSEEQVLLFYTKIEYFSSRIFCQETGDSLKGTVNHLI
jgi:hypothetical protein